MFIKVIDIVEHEKNISFGALLTFFEKIATKTGTRVPLRTHHLLFLLFLKYLNKHSKGEITVYFYLNKKKTTKTVSESLLVSCGTP